MCLVYDCLSETSNQIKRVIAARRINQSEVVNTRPQMKADRRSENKSQLAPPAVLTADEMKPQWTDLKQWLESDNLYSHIKLQT